VLSKFEIINNHIYYVGKSIPCSKYDPIYIELANDIFENLKTINPRMVSFTSNDTQLHIDITTTKSSSISIQFIDGKIWTFFNIHVKYEVTSNGDRIKSIKKEHRKNEHAIFHISNPTCTVDAANWIAIQENDVWWPKRAD